MERYNTLIIAVILVLGAIVLSSPMFEKRGISYTGMQTTIPGAPSPIGLGEGNCLWYEYRAPLTDAYTNGFAIERGEAFATALGKCKGKLNFYYQIQTLEKSTNLESCVYHAVPPLDAAGLCALVSSKYYNECEVNNCLFNDFDGNACQYDCVWEDTNEDGVINDDELTCTLIPNSCTQGTGTGTWECFASGSVDIRDYSCDAPIAPIYK